MFASSYSPLSLIVAVQDFDWSEFQFHNPVQVVGLLVFAAISTWFCFQVMANLGDGVRITIKRVNDRSNELVNYTIPYVVSFLGLKLDDLGSLLGFMIFMGIMFVLTVRTRSLFVNPVLAMKGYVLYDAEYDDHGNTKQKLVLSPRELKSGEVCEVEGVSPFLVIVVPK